MSRAVLSLDIQCRLMAMPEPVREFRFAPPRRWRFDFAWPLHKLAVEQEGGVFTRGRHTRGAGYVKDLEKYAEATCLGWTVLRVTPQMVADGTALEWVRRILERHDLGSRLVS